MNVPLRKYLDEKTIVVDIVETYPKFIIEVFDSNIEFLRLYFEEEKRIHLEDIENEYHPTENRNRYLKKFNYLASILARELYDNEYYILGFHASRLLNEEVLDIRKNGLCLFDSQKHYKKLELLAKYGFSQEEIMLLQKCSWVDKQHRKEKVCFSTIIRSVNFDGGLDDVFGIWGGEITFWDKDGIEGVIEKLKSIGNPYVVVAKLDIPDVYFMESVVRSLMRHFILNSKIEGSDLSFQNNNFEILDVVQFNRDVGDLLVL